MSRLTYCVNRFDRAAACWAVALVATLALGLGRLVAQEPASDGPPAPPHGNAAPAAPLVPSRPATADGDQPDASSTTHRLREGTRLKDRLGHFRQTGESITFVDEEGRELGGLPNLNLERITRMLKSVDEPESVSWSVSGTVTEFGGRNFLLVSRAVFKAAAAPPAPDNIE